MLSSREGIRWPDSTSLRLRGELRSTDIDGLPDGARVLSLFLVNERRPLERDRDLNFIFQVKLTMRYAAGFLARPNRRGESADDSDQRVLALMFRDRFEWAVGHNTSVEAPKPDDDGEVRELRTTQLPRHEVRDVKHEAVPGIVTEMERLAQLDGVGLGRALSPLVEAYEGWIEKQRRAQLDRDELEQTRDGLMGEADRVRDRMREGIQLLATDDEVRESFQIANRAMHIQALQADKWREDKRYTKGKKPKWRPFQLAFVLINLASVADPADKDRRVADLIYFPTGGGKTEAYLGLIAYTLILRRIRGKARPDEGRGVAVILRYTLRLLTLDQLGRAATLMCALEELRRRKPKLLGNTRFSVGLWVGKSATANRLKEVHQTLHDFTPGRTDSPFPLPTCPWCGADIKIHNIKLVDAKGKPSKTKYIRAVVYCDDRDCLYTERKRPGQGLPVLFVDEQIYKELPDFLVATVDKFAMMPWRGDAGMLFGRASHLDDGRAYGVMHDPPKGARPLTQGLYPPELIIQDELHLISGPLGTMVGLYETAIDYLCARKIDGETRVPKVVCSTATVRRAREQIRALFQREMAIFPPRGINDGNNFFSTINDKDPGRMYIGVAAPGRALRAVSVRTYATLLAAAQKHFDPKGALDQPADPYMTLVGYFNSLRELGGMRRLVEDEVRTRVADFADGGYAKRPHYFVGPHPWAANRKLTLPAELTSRESTDRIKETKQRLGARRADPNTNKERGGEPLDVVLASNMISVGLDVDRLGLMVVTGQPKTSSEYIQATSRVGRNYPGLVVTCLNASRPRDRSHYERFVAYHESFYREVEATSVTPFSIQTLQRGMVGTLLSMIRHGILEMAGPTGMMHLHDNRSRADKILEALVTRGRKHREWYDDDAEKRIRDELRARGKHFLDAWERVVERANTATVNRTYSVMDRARDEGTSVMFTATDDPPDDLDERRFMAPTSMRDVEPNTHIWIRFAQLDERR
ncbi:hypothetical protein ENSA5_30870 [Enhygromyxa salina]|uniref:Helicase C-terminal domain-containing protein n=1 Tax=Enhygromyxa salina TaxID=215803 RepID=A0A2S9XYC1_9BACT|nr:hypothetical protein ENSA5_30870 [Enhygromyxa salina]